VSEQQVPQSGHLGQQDDLGDSEATGSAIDENKQAGPFIKIIEKPRAAAPAKAPEQRQERAPAARPVPIIPDASLDSVLDILEYGLLTTLLEAASSRPGSQPRENGSSPGLCDMLGAAALSAGALPLSIRVPDQAQWRRIAGPVESKRRRRWFGS